VPAALDRFVSAQAHSFDEALTELKTGRKRGHWMWFVFPQLRELGHSATARFYGISSAEEARAFLSHSVLGPRLLASCAALLTHRGRRVADIMGSIDALKLRSSMTLFESVADQPEPFREVLEAFYGGEPDALTMAVLVQRSS
jgi:uncharacterized protein (DUF1810 family)